MKLNTQHRCPPRSPPRVVQSPRRNINLSRTEKVVVAVYGSSNENAPIFGGHNMPVNKNKQVICVYDAAKRKCVWISCPHIDFMAVQIGILENGLMCTEAIFNCNLDDMSGDGTQSNMKVLGPTFQVVLKACKVNILARSCSHVLASLLRDA